MPGREIAVKFMGATQKTVEDGRKVYRAVATGIKMDRYGEVVMPKGAITDSFLDNPVMLDIHDYQNRPVGSVVELDIGDDEIQFEFVFANNEQGLAFEKDYVDGTMNAFSIGFIPQKYVSMWDMKDEKGNPAKEVELELADGSKRKLDLTKYARMPVRIYTAWELLEISPVSVPAYPDALMMRALAHEARVFSTEIEGEFYDERIEEALTDLQPHLDRFVGELRDFRANGAVASHSTPVVEKAWDGASARAKLAEWASSDGSGDKEKMAWGKYARGFGWYDSNSKDAYGSYKLPHHTISESALVAVKRGVTSAMAALLGARGGTDVDGDEKAVYRHLSKHYKDMEMDPPELKDYSKEELKAIDEGTYVPKGTKEPPAEPSTNPEGVVPPVDVRDLITALEKSVAKALKEFTEQAHFTAIKINMLMEHLDQNGQSDGGEGTRSTGNEPPEPQVMISKELQDLLDRVAPMDGLNADPGNNNEEE